MLQFKIGGPGRQDFQLGHMSQRSHCKALVPDNCRHSNFLCLDFHYVLDGVDPNFDFLVTRLSRTR